MSGHYATVLQKLTGFRMTRVLINIDPANKSVTFKQGLRGITIYLDPWPDTDEEIEAQANAKLPAYTGDDDVKTEIAFNTSFVNNAEEL